MAEVSETTMKKKKKKGRPSLLDLQKRFIKQQNLDQQLSGSFNLSSISTTRSSRRNPNAQPEPHRIAVDDDDDDERTEKKHKLLLGLNSRPHYPTLSSYSLSRDLVPNGSNSSAGGEDPEAAFKRRKIAAIHLASDEMDEKFLKATDRVHGSEVGPTTPLPDKKLLLFILDRLQKKDTHGVFSEPVDAEELPDYFETIDNPMDFGTVRKKLDTESYANLEEFEKDIFLICSNAMQYNAPDTIFFRQARSIQELAKKDFHNLRQDSDDDGEPEPEAAKRGRPPAKNPKKPHGRPSSECVGSRTELSSGATVVSGGNSATGFNNIYNLRRGNHTSKFHHVDAVAKGSHGSQNCETVTNWLSEWQNEFPASVLRSVLKYGKNHQISVDENRRDSYKQSLASFDRLPLMFGGEPRQLLAVGLDAEHSYARSIAQFSADLGPVVWKVASKKIMDILPVGLDFGPGWIGHNERPKQLMSSSTKGDMFSNGSQAIDDSLTAGTSSFDQGISNRFSLPKNVDIIRESDLQNETMLTHKGDDRMAPASCFEIERPQYHRDSNGLNGGFGSDYSTEMQVTRFLGTSRSGNVPAPAHVGSSGEASRAAIIPASGFLSIVL